MAWHHALRTHCPQGHEYTPENTYRYSRGRMCRQCNRDRSRARAAAKRAVRIGFVNVTCIACRKEWLKRADTIENWAGRCRGCATKIVSQGQREELSRRAKAQIEAQGGIPNRRVFTSERVRGAANSRWKGGITPENERLRHSQEYKEWRIAVFKRDGFSCQICGERPGPIRAHHIEPWAKAPEKRFDVNNGLTVCIPCHRKLHFG